MSESNNETTIQLPIRPKDVFRILALRSVVENREMIKALLKHFDEIVNGILQTERLKRPNPFNYTHKGLNVPKSQLADFTERELCASDSKRAFFGKAFDSIGEVIDYELPLDEKRNSAFGKVDLVSLKGSTLYLLEVKRHDSTEHPLRAMFEIFTFWKMLQSKEGGFGGFIQQYSGIIQQYSSANRMEDGQTLTSVVPGLLLCDGSSILNRLIALKTLENTDVSEEEKQLYNLFIDKGLRVFSYGFSYGKDKIKSVNDRTDEIKGVLGVNNRTACIFHGG